MRVHSVEITYCCEHMTTMQLDWNRGMLQKQQFICDEMSFSKLLWWLKSYLNLKSIKLLFIFSSRQTASQLSSRCSTIHSSTHPSTHPPIHRSARPSVDYASIHLPIHPPIHPSIYSSVHPSIYPFFRLSVRAFPSSFLPTTLLTFNLLIS